MKCFEYYPLYPLNQNVLADSLTKKAIYYFDLKVVSDRWGSFNTNLRKPPCLRIFSMNFEEYRIYVCEVSRMSLSILNWYNIH